MTQVTKTTLATIFCAIFLPLTTRIHAEEVSENIQNYQGYELPEKETNAVFYVCSYTDQDLTSWLLARFVLKLWRNGDSAFVKLYSPQLLTNREEPQSVLKKFSPVTASFAWNPDGFSGPPKLEYPENTNAATIEVMDVIRPWVFSIFRAFPKDAPLKIGEKWEEIHPAKQRQPIKRWTVDEELSPFPSRREFLIVGHQNFADKTKGGGQIDLVSRFEFYHYDATAKRNRRITKDLVSQLEISKGKNPRHMDQEHMVIYEIREPEKARSNDLYRKPPATQ